MGILSEDCELEGARHVLRAAAWTYVAAVVGAIGSCAHVPGVEPQALTSRLGVAHERHGGERTGDTGPFPHADRLVKGDGTNQEQRDECQH